MTASDENGGKFSASASPAHRCVRLLLSGFQPTSHPAVRIWSQVITYQIPKWRNTSSGTGEHWLHYYWMWCLRICVLKECVCKFQNNGTGVLLSHYILGYRTRESHTAVRNMFLSPPPSQRRCELHLLQEEIVLWMLARFAPNETAK